MARTLGTGVKTEEADAGSETGDDASRVLGDVWTWVLADDVGLVLLLVSENVGVLQLCWVFANTAAVVDHGLRRIGGVGGHWWWQVVLEEKVVLVGNTANAAEDIALHEILDVRAKAINDVVVIPQVKLRNLSVGASKWLGVVPADVVGEVVVIALFAQFLWEWVVASLSRVRDFGPVVQWSVNTNAIVVDLITSSKPVLVSLCSSAFLYTVLT